jgi:NitT/TauT family transport system substrate-binding protein
MIQLDHRPFGADLRGEGSFGSAAICNQILPAKSESPLNVTRLQPGRIGRRAACAGLGLALLGACSPPKTTLRRLRFATDWRPEAEHGGFYQALATGEYERRGLRVEIVPGGPSANVPQLVASGAVEMGLGTNSFIALNLAQARAPVKAVAAFMQKDPQVLIAHPDQGIGSIADMKGRPILLADAQVTGFWLWLKARYGFSDAQVRKYAFNNGPFLSDRRLIQQGYLTSEPYTISKQGHLDPVVFLLADEGYPSYAALALASVQLIATAPEAVQAFVDASAAGWTAYLHADPSPADTLIRQANPEMTQDVLDQAREKMRAYGLVDSGDARTLGVGAMTDARWSEFFGVVAGQGVYPRDLDFKRGYTLQFVDKVKGTA